MRARSIAIAVDGANIDLAKDLAKKDSPVKVINELLRLSNIPIEISVGEHDEIFASKSGSPLYSIVELSDGERNVLLIAATVLTAKPGTLLLIDEPERHLHRSIISPLLSLLFAKRLDCAFVVSTHDVTLPLDNPKAQTMLVRGCAFSGSSLSTCDVDLVPANSNIDEALKRDILGSRKRLLFVEGEDGSLDKPLYSLLFPNVSVVAKTTCRDVEHAVVGIRSAADLHWLRAYGIVDNDGRTVQDIGRLKEKGVYAVPAHSVESLYYHPELQRGVAVRHAAITRDDANTRLKTALDAGLIAVTPHIQRLCERVVEKALREELDRQWPKKT